MWGARKAWSNMDSIIAWLIAFLKGKAGTVARGLLWGLGLGLAALANHGIKLDDGTTKSLTDAVGNFAEGIVGAACVLISTWWSHKKDAKLLATTPPQTK